mmetsp:Transcript_25580/g.78676  ORF Transcript_25580/g.78676 Transcript_25580/m.78676 type:complete len:223 (-) Transcript_25580:255-923(-)
MAVLRRVVASVVSLLLLSPVQPLAPTLTRTKNLPSSTSHRAPRVRRNTVEMKRKGKGPGGRGVPGRVPTQALEQQRQYDQMMKEREESGMPTFELYVKGPRSPTWYPCGALGGDDQSKQLVDSWMNGGFLSDQAKGAIDKGVASSLFKDKQKLVAQVLGQYPQLKPSKASLIFGYKIFYKGLLDKRKEANKVTELDEALANQETPIDKVKNAFSSVFGGLGT